MFSFKVSGRIQGFSEVSASDLFPYVVLGGTAVGQIIILKCMASFRKHLQ